MAISPVINGHHREQSNGAGSSAANVKSYARIAEVLDVPHLILSQIQSYDWFKSDGLAEVFREFSPITDYTGKKYELHFLEHSFEEPKLSPTECKELEKTYSQPLSLKALLMKLENNERLEQDIFMGEIPLMTENGTFIINGAERVVVSQLVRSPGVYFKYEKNTTTDRNLCVAQIIPSRGAWLEFETSTKDILSVKVDRKRRVSITTFFRALGVTRDEILERFADVDTDERHLYIQTTLDRDQVPTDRDLHFREDDLRNVWEWLRPDQAFDIDTARQIAWAQIELYRRLRPGEPPSVENASNLIKSSFFDPRRYDLGRVGRYKFNRRLGIEDRTDLRILTLEDMLQVVRTLVLVNRGEERADDIDHLGNRRVRAVGELVQNQVRIGLSRMERMVKEKMTLVDIEEVAPRGLVNVRPVVAAVREFFGGSQLSQFMDQTNPLAELTHKRRLSALGPGGLSRERAGFDVRDVHFSHYGRICPIETPEGPNIGLLSSLASYARTNPYGFIESPYRRVLKTISSTAQGLEGRFVTESVVDSEGNILVASGRRIPRTKVKAVQELPAGTILRVRPYVAGGPEYVEYMSADREENFRIAQANSELDDLGQFVHDRVEIRLGENYIQDSPDNVDLMDVSPMQIMSISAALIPFLEHDDANRALMGSNMQRQAVPLLRPQVPVVGTGIEERVARDSGQVVLARSAGVVTSVSGKEIIITDSEGGGPPTKSDQVFQDKPGHLF
ncbi:DNA-directed RNA polymerase subunit beta [Geodia barretti]|uniref:DNA-directed RNA polymerase n=1 Tax=Geodia barretti TaxID=519541 RepID=A0AA35RKU9_GEOBA|nr:DNA-directed RNA polymerase subunit beta [Geodia barretti]